MTRSEREAVAHKFNVLVSTMQHSPNAADDPAGWRRRWNDITALVAELDAVADRGVED
jgi:hypothetical protein